MEETETWFEVQYSRPSANDWFGSGDSKNTQEDAVDYGKIIRVRTGFDIRIAEVTLTKKIVEVL